MMMLITCAFIIALVSQKAISFNIRPSYLRNSLTTNTKGIVNTRTATRKQATSLSSSITNNDFFGESRNSFMLKEFSTYDDLSEIVKLSSMALPERPDGIVTVAKYTSATRRNCVDTEDQYERLARTNPATLFLRCFEEYENASMILAQAQIASFPTYDVYYGGNRVARVDGDMMELERILDMYQLQNSSLDLFSEDANNDRRLAWGEGKANSSSSATPRTTARFIPGYDWNTNAGAFDEAANKAQDSFEDMYGNWLPNTEDN